MPVSQRTIIQTDPSCAGGQWEPRYALLDPLRGIASLLVVFHHIPGQPLGRWAGELGVMLFFVISGYCIAAAWHRAAQSEQPWHREVARFVLRRLRRIFPPWWATLLLWVVFAGLARAGAIDPSTWALNATLLHWTHLVTTLDGQVISSASANPIGIMGIAWTLCYEEQFYALMALSLALTLRWKRAWPATLLAGVLLGAGAAWMWTFPHRATGLILDYAGQFAFGIVLYVRLCGARSATVRWLLTLTLFGACAAILSTHLLRYPGVPLLADEVRRVRHNTRELAVASIAACALLLARPLDGWWRTMRDQSGACSRVLVNSLAGLGAISYSLYLTHTLPAHHVEAAVAHLPAWMRVLAHLFSQLALAAAFWWLIERHFVGSSRSTKPAARIASPASE